jgi:hypothetical protein
VDITVIVPTIYPRSHLLERALRSVEAQTYRAARTVIEVDTEREGPAAVRNRALEKVTTEWTAFLDDDDELYPNHLRMLARFVWASGVDVAYPGYDCTGHDKVNCFGVPFNAAFLRQTNYIPVTVLARTDKIRQAGGFQPHPDENGDPCEDWGLWLAMVDQGAKFGHLQAKTWLWHNDEETTRGRPDRW